MFLLSKEEKISFLKVIYSANMFDSHIQDEEKDILEALKTEVFGLDEFQKIDLGPDGIVKEINKIDKVVPTIYLFNILYELGKYYGRDGSNLNKNKEDKLEEEYKKKIDYILDKVSRKDDILKSQIFLYAPEMEKKREELKGEAKTEDTMDNIMDSATETIEKTTSMFKKLFK